MERAWSVHGAVCMELAVCRSVVPHGAGARTECGVMRGLAVAAMIDRSCIRSANLVENLGTCLLVFVLG
jgi:hypothetical protein